MAAQLRVVAVEAQRTSLLIGGEIHRVEVRQPVERSAAAADVGVALLFAHNDGVGHSHRRVGQEEEVAGGSVGGEVVDMALAVQTTGVEAQVVAIVALAAIGRQAAGGKGDVEAKEVVALHLEGLGNLGENACRGQHTVECKAVGHKIGQAVDRERVEGIVEALALVLSTLYGTAVVVDIAVLATLEDGVLGVLDEAAVVVGTVDGQASNKVGQRRAHKLLNVRIGEVGNVEFHPVDGGHLKGVLLITEVTIADLKDELAALDLAAEMQRTVLADMNRTTRDGVGVDNHLMAVADDELFHATYDEVVVSEAHTGIDPTGGALKGKGVVVETTGPRDRLHIVFQLIFHQHTACQLIVGHQTVTAEVVYHEQGLGHVKTNVVGELLGREAVAIGLGKVVDSLHRADFVDTLYLTELTVGIIVAAFEGGGADRPRRSQG